METLVATVLIVVIFMMASLLLNSIYASSIQGNNQPLKTQFQKLEYAHRTGKISIPYAETWQDWEIEMFEERITTNAYVVMEATKKETQQKIKAYAVIKK